MEDQMKDLKTLDRREFTLAAAMAALAGVAITITACGGSSPTAPTTAGGTGTGTGGGTGTGNGDKTGVVSANHGHLAVITSAQLTLAGALSLNIQGSADHPHGVDLSAAEIATIAANGRVSKLSSTNSGHDHTVTFN
jgi:hypothetical protein